MVVDHFHKSKYENHVLQSAERFYGGQEILRPSSSVTSFNRRSRISSRSKCEAMSTGLVFSNSEKMKGNPEMVTGLEGKTYRIT